MYLDKSIISKYTSYFHDGSLIAINYGNDDTELTLTMESAEVDPEDIKDPIPLAKEDRIKGKLHLKGVKSIYINDKKIFSPLKMNYDDGEILHLKIKNNKVLLDISWCNYPPKARDTDFSSITINVEDVRWENIPDLKT
ncbi:MAG: hypothetical protein FJ356_03175 [Thaumarchaeota archaeon]|nr:hypothetical protein [Nitrososphaerota archaeon]